MHTASAGSSLARLRAKTDRQLAILLRRELNRGIAHARAARHQDAVRSLAAAEILLGLAEISGRERASLEEKFEEIRQAVPQRAMTAA